MWVSNTLFTPTVSAILAKQTTVTLKLWHGFNVTLLLSAMTIALGILFFYFRPGLSRLLPSLKRLDVVTPTRLFKSGLHGFLSLSNRLTRLLQSGNLGHYLIIIFSVMLIGLWSRVLSGHNVINRIILNDVGFFELVLIALMIGAAFMAIFSRSRLAAVAALGVVGYGVAMIYILHGAPDVAITQLVIETLTVVLFVLVLYRFPPFTKLSPKFTRIRDAALAGVVAVLMTTLVLLESSSTPMQSISGFFVENSVNKAHGHNIVNVILVDFRGLDTLGEITVLSVAALGVFALLRLIITKKES